MSMLGVKVRTALALRPSSLVRVAWYRAGIGWGFNPVRKVGGAAPVGSMFRATGVDLNGFSNRMAVPDAPVGKPAPDWNTSAYSGVPVREAQRDWWEIPDFDPEVGDIKGVWAASRFDWVVTLAQHACAGNAEALVTLNAWIEDWCRNNGPFKGPNWKCGQEASIRVMHLATAALVLGQAKEPEPALLDLVGLHLARIAPTLSYAIGQDNNHGTSEAAALFIGGSWLEHSGREVGRRWQSAGRHWLENRAAELISEDGTFSQYSVNYHRVMLDTFSFTEVWRRALDLSKFSPRFLARSEAAAQWLRTFVRPENGDAPNIGANDGARLIPLSRTDYRDFRPSVQLATMLFSGRRAYAEQGPWDSPVEWLGVEPNAQVAAPVHSAVTFDEGGFAVLRQEDAMAVVRYPRFRFRPSQADALHVDLWLADANLLRDAGTYSYNTEERWLRYFPGTESHNTVQFDGRDQMPRLGRFLFGDWLATDKYAPARETADGVLFEAGYTDRQGATHRRKVLLHATRLQVQDDVSGFRYKAVLRWRLTPGSWWLEGDLVTNGTHALRVGASVTPVRFELVEGWESRYYMEKSTVPVLEVELDRAAVITSEYRWRR